MAAEEGTQQGKQRLYKGLNTDVSPIDQPDGTYRFALNAINETRDGNTNFLSNEEGNTPYESLTYNGSDYLVIGNIYIDDNEHIVFGVTYDETKSFIALLTGNGELIVQVDDTDNSCLNFRLSNQIQGEFRLRNGCEKTVYWVDNLNKPRSLNLDDIPDTSNCGDFDLIPGYNEIPIIEFLGTTNQGQVKSGTFNLAIRLVDENGNGTAWITSSQTVPVIVKQLSGAYDSIYGSSNTEVYTDTDAAIFGQPPSGKALKFKITNIDSQYKYYQVAVICATASTRTPTNVYVSTRINSEIDIFIYDGNISNYTEIPIEEIYVAPVNISTAKTIEQVENRLLLANTKGPTEDLCSFQVLASKIKTQYTTKVVAAKDYDVSGNPKNPNTMWDTMSMMGGEVYALGIVYIFDDYETPAYHIPGRPEKAGDRTLVDDINSTFLGSGGQETWKVYDTAEAWDNLNPENGKDLAFWEMKTNVYEARPEAGCGEQFDYWGKDYLDNDLVDTKIRHHKMPTRNTVPLKSNSTQVLQSQTITITLTIPVVSQKPSHTIPYEFFLTVDYTTGAGATLPVTRTVSFTEAEWSTLIINDTVNIQVAIESGTAVLSTNPADYVLNKTVFIDDNAASAAGWDYLDASFTNPFTPTSVEIVNGYTNDASDDIVLIGTEFSNIELPVGCTGYYFVRGERDEFNRTILGKGFCGHTREDSNFIIYNAPIDTNVDEVPEQSVEHNYAARTKYILSPENLFLNSELNGDYIKIEGEFEKQTQSRSTTGQVQNVDDTKTGWADNDGFDWVGGNTLTRVAWVNNLGELNRDITDNSHLVMLSKQPNYSDNDNPGTTKTLYNTAADNKLQFIALDNAVEPSEVISPGGGFPDYIPSQGADTVSPYNRIYYVSQKIDIDVHPILDNIIYYKMHTNPFTDTPSPTDTKDIYGGDTFISEMKLTSGTMQGYKTEPNLVEFVIGIIAILAAAVITVVTAGAGSLITGPLLALLIAASAVSAATSIVMLAAKTFVKDQENTSLRGLMRHITWFRAQGDTSDDAWISAMDVVDGTYIESDINVGYREVAKGSASFIQELTQSGINEYEKDKFLYKDEGRWRLLAIPMPEVYKYNVDFSRQNKEKVYFSLPSTYNCCSDCIEEFPHRIVYSEQAFAEEISDNYNSFLPLNYIDIPGEHGEITNIFAVKNALYAHTKSILWYIPQNIQERLTGDVISLIGTGGFFNSTPRPVHDDDIGAAGSTQQFATIKTKYGVFFVDDVEGKIYVLNFSSQTGTQIEELTDIKRGMSKWFRSNIPMNLWEDIYLSTRYKYPYASNPANNIYGVGFTTALDEENRRILFTKKDYAITDNYKGKGVFSVVDDPTMKDGASAGACLAPPIPDVLYFNTDDNRFYTEYCISENKFYALVPFTNDEIFIDKSWTMSYSLNSGSWTSWHSYTPNTYIYDHLNLYSASNNFEIWKHNIPDTYHIFYGVDYYHIIDYVALINPMETALTDEITLQTTATKLGVEQRYVTFDKFIAYNSRQCSGELELVPLDYLPDSNYMMRSVINEAGKIGIRKFEKDWKINGFKDYRIDYDTPIFVEDWDSIKSEYFIDKIINVSSIDFTKDWTQLERFRDKYMRIRLIATNINDTKLTTNYTMQREKSVNI